jgi:cytidylate kinase
MRRGKMCHLQPTRQRLLAGFLFSVMKERRQMTTITISRQYGSGGDEIAQRVCESLNYRQFDKQLLNQAAAESGLSEQEVVDFSEENYKIRGFLDRLFDRSPTVATVRAWGTHGEGVLVAEELQLREESLLKLVHRAVRIAHKRGAVVILGRGGQALLSNENDVLHVRFTAPLEDRILRVKQRIKADRQIYDATIDLRRDAQDLILEKDAASRAYLKRFYNIDWDDPHHYHVIINTARVSLEQAARITTDLASQMTA